MISICKGIGLRQEFAQYLSEQPRETGVDFLEVTPDNWFGLGGKKRAQLDRIADRYPLVAHGLSLSIADSQAVNMDYLSSVRDFLDDYGIAIYSDHLSLCRDSSGYLYDLIPVPRRKEAIAHIVDRVGRVQDFIGRQLVLENISYYHNYPGQMDEAEFIAEIAGRSGCGILLDINNVYVNATNHGYDAASFVRAIPSSAIVYYHVAGHLQREDSSLLDTHGAPVQDPVIDLCRTTVDIHGHRPLLLERDHHVPPFPQLVRELAEIAGQLEEHSDAA